MQVVTAAVIAVGSLLALRKRPVQAVAAYLIVLCWYPTFLTIKVGTLDFSASRLLIMVVLLRLVLSPGVIASFKIAWIDVFVLLAFVGRFGGLLVNESMATVFEREMGTFFDTCLAYSAARLGVRTNEDFVEIIKTLLVISVGLVFFGLYQCWTGNNVFGFMRQYDAWNPHEQEKFNRIGWYRADVTFNVSISFGLFFSVLFALCAGLGESAGWSRQRKMTLLVIMTLGVFSSMSSAPLFAIIITLFFMAMYPYRKYWLYLSMVAIAFVAAIELYSNRHVPHVLGRVAFSSENVYYRIGLVSEAFGGGMDDHWTYGYGYIGLGPDEHKKEFDWYHQDMVNIYIARLARTGLTGAVPFVILTLLPYVRLRKAFLRAPTQEDQWLLWCFGAGLIGWQFAFMTVNLLNQMLMLYYVFMGIAASSPHFYENRLPDWLRAPVQGMRRTPRAV